MKAIKLRCHGVGRDRGSITALQFHFSRPVSDAEMHWLREVMQRAAACIPEKASLPGGEAGHAKDQP